MSYVLGQYNNTAGENTSFMTLITDGVAGRCQLVDASSSASGLNFEDECIVLTEGVFQTNRNYYFHGKIKLTDLQGLDFSVKMINVDASSGTGTIPVFKREGTDEQYIKTISLPGSADGRWVDITFSFSPLTTFNCISFELQRTQADYQGGIRYPLIIYEELSEINNIINRAHGMKEGVNLIKIGVQSRPGLLMNINGEEIRTNRTGIYEIKNGIVVVSTFSVVASAKEDGTALIDEMNRIDTAWEAGDPKSTIGSGCIIDSSKTRTIDSFTLDYLYKDE